MPRVAKLLKTRHDPLHVELEQDESLRRFGRVSHPGRRKRTSSNGVDEEEVKYNSSVRSLADGVLGRRKCPYVSEDPRFGEGSAG